MTRHTMPRALRRLFAVCAVLLGFAAPAHALCLAPLCTCSVSTTSMAFGTYNPLSGLPADGTGSVRMQCGGVAGLLIPYQVAMGAGGSGNVNARQLASGPNRLNYGLYADAARVTGWGDGVGLGALNAGILLDVLGLAPPKLHTVYGRIPAGQAAVPGLYADTLSVVVTYY